MLAAALPLALSGLVAAEAVARPRLVQSVDVQIPVSPAPVRIAGRVHLGYELHITNLNASEVSLARIEVLDADRGTPLSDLHDAKLVGRLGRPGARRDLPKRQVIGGGMRAVAYLWVALDDHAPLPRELEHRITFDLIRSSGQERGVVENAGVLVRHDPPLVLGGAPLRGGPWAAVYDPLLVGGHRTSIYTINGRARIPARFAIDWIKLNADGSRANGDASLVANWHGYGADVLAVADGAISAASDDIAEGASIAASQGPIALENASGNYVTLDLGGGRYAFYEHLKRGSIRVKPGDHVKKGSVLGELGNSGSSSSGPHLHFHVGDANSTLAAEGQPYVFDTFRVLGGYGTIDAFQGGGPWGPAQAGTGGSRSKELPAPNVVVVFDSEDRRAPR